MIADSYAIIDPWAVVIEAFHTLITDAAMARPLSSYDLTIGAQQNWVKIFEHGLKNKH